jgi:hypothetical protein
MKPSREAPREPLIFFTNPHNTRRDVNSGNCHEEFTCEDYLNSEEKRESYCTKKSGKAVVGE